MHIIIALFIVSRLSAFCFMMIQRLVLYLLRRLAEVERLCVHIHFASVLCYLKTWLCYFLKVVTVSMQNELTKLSKSTVWVLVALAPSRPVIKWFICITSNTVKMQLPLKPGMCRTKHVFYWLDFKSNIYKFLKEAKFSTYLFRERKWTFSFFHFLRLE